MRLLFEGESSDELNNTKELLESRGIPVFISGTESFRMRPLSVLYKKGLWVCLDEQFEDAAMLLKTPDHEVTNPVDVDAFHSSLEKLQREPLRGLWLNRDKILNTVSIIVVLVVFVVALMLFT